MRTDTRTAYGPPDLLRIVDGELVLADGGDVREYLRAYAKRAGITPDTPVNVIHRGYLTLLVMRCGIG